MTDPKSHRESAEHAVFQAPFRPVLSAVDNFAERQVHALEYIAAQLGEMNRRERAGWSEEAATAGPAD